MIEVFAGGGCVCAYSAGVRSELWVGGLLVFVWSLDGGDGCMIVDSCGLSCGLIVIVGALG